MALTANEVTATNTLLDAQVNTSDIALLLIICQRTNQDPRLAANLWVQKKIDVDTLLFQGSWTNATDVTRPPTG